MCHRPSYIRSDSSEPAAAALDSPLQARPDGRFEPLCLPHGLAIPRQDLMARFRAKHAHPSGEQPEMLDRLAPAKRVGSGLPQWTSCGRPRHYAADPPAARNPATPAEWNPVWRWRRELARFNHPVGGPHVVGHHLHPATDVRESPGPMGHLVKVDRALKGRSGAGARRSSREICHGHAL